MKKLLVIAVLLITISISACKKSQEVSQSPADKSKFKVGLVFDVGGRGDKSFNDAAHNGLEKAKKEFGIEYEEIDPGDGADRESALRKLASNPEITMIFGVGFIFTEDITKMAIDFPKKKFACVDYSVNPQTKIPDNLVALEFKEEEGSFLVGVLAALTTKTNTIGFIGGMESSLIRKFEKGFTQGAKFINPDIKVLVTYVSVTGEGFKNPGKAEEIAISQYSKGADIIYHASGLSGIGLFKAAKENKKLAIGVDMDQYKEAEGFVLTSMIKIVDEVIYQTISDYRTGTFKNGIKSLGLKEKGVGFVYDNNNKALILPAHKDKLDEITKKIISGEIKVSAE
ncbi:MAG: BMP family ABC transporter substrate-binding protein [Ignavibacteriota bacterium]|nr:BMP family ABC transporter substrate-binding protein [Ignavibacteriota bacterium]